MGIKKRISDYVKFGGNCFSSANVYSEEYLLFKKKCQEQGLRITRASAALFRMFINGEIELYD